MITVFTPSYNRANTLKSLYESLSTQNNVDFEWLIVDDGSSDDTREFINRISKTSKMKINYIYQENAGKQAAYNKGLKNANGDIFFCIDSDDVLAENSLENIQNDFEKINDVNIAGIMYMQGYINDNAKIIGSYFPEGLIDTYFNVYHKYKVTGDKLIVLKTDVAKRYYFPMIDGEKFIPEALIYNRMSLKYNFVCENKIMAYKEYLNDGYSANYFNLVKKNPKGNALYYLELYKLDPSVYNVYGYLLFCFFAKEKNKIIFKHPNKLMVILLYIPVWIIYKIRK